MYLDDFNDAAKVVNSEEMVAKYKELLKAELSFKEKALLYTVEKPVSAIANVRYMLGLLHEHGENVPGMQQDEQTNDLYMTGAFLQAAADNDVAKSFVPELTRKAHEIGARAFRECEDHRARFPNIG